MEENNQNLDSDIKALTSKQRLLLSLTLIGALSLFVSLSVLFYLYIRQPAPLPELIDPDSGRQYQPHYLFSIYGVIQPVGLALSPQEDRLYVSEMGGERLIKMFDNDGNLLGSFPSLSSSPGERSPVYLAADELGRLYVPDRSQQVIYIFDRDGNHLDTLLGPGATLSGLDFETGGDAYIKTSYSNNQQLEQVNLLSVDGIEQKPPIKTLSAWAPLGVRFDNQGNMLVTDVSLGHHCVHRIAPQTLWVSDNQPSYTEHDVMFGTSGNGPGEFMFPNVAVADSRGRIYVSDGNNGRISVWDKGGYFLFHFGLGSGEGFVRLPRGLHIDYRDNLYIVDTVGHDIKVYDVSGSEPVFKFAFGDLGLGDGLFNYPNDIVVDATGRLYIADRENQRVQVWSY